MARKRFEKRAYNFLLRLLPLIDQYPTWHNETYEFYGRKAVVKTIHTKKLDVKIFVCHDDKTLQIHYVINHNTHKLDLLQYDDLKEKNIIVNNYKQLYDDLSVNDEQLKKQRETLKAMLDNPYWKKRKEKQILDAINDIDNLIENGK